jgi:hypothetical protein
MARNIFEIIIGDSAAGSVETAIVDIIVENSTFSNWNAVGQIGYSLAQDWQHSGFEYISLLGGALQSLNIDNSDFDSGWNPKFLYPTNSAHSSFYQANSWEFILNTLENSGLTQNGLSNLEDASTTGYSYYNADVDELAPSLTVYGRKSAEGDASERVNKLDSRYINDASDTHPTTSANFNNKQYLNSVYLADNFALDHDSRVNFGSVRTANTIAPSNSQAITISGSLNTDNRGFRVNDNEGNYISFLVFGFDNANARYYPSINKYYEDDVVDIWGQRHYAEIESSLFASYLNLPSKTVNYQLPPVVLSLENIFPDHVIGTNVELEVKYQVGIMLAVGSMPNAYTDGLPYGTPTNHDFNDMQYALANSYQVTDGVVSGAASGSFFPVITNSEETYNYNSSSNSPLLVGGVGGATHLLIRHNNPAVPANVVRSLLTFDKAQSYNCSICLRESNVPITVRIRALNSDGSTREVLIQQEILAVGTTPTTERFNFSFDSSSSTADHCIDIMVQDTQAYNGYVRVSYIRLEKSTYAIQEMTTIEDYDPSSQDGFLFLSGSYVQLGNSRKRSDAPLVFTTSNLTKYTANYSKYSSSSPYYTEHSYSSNGEGFNPDESTITDKENIILPFHNSDGQYVEGQNQLESEETERVHPLHDSNIYDVDGFPKIETLTKRINLKVGSNDLHVFLDKEFSDNHVYGTYMIHSIEFFDSENSFITRATSGGNFARYKYDPSNGVKAPLIKSMSPIPSEFLGQDVTVTAFISSASGDNLRVDTGENTTSEEFNAIGSVAVTIPVEGEFIRLRSETAAEKGSALAGNDVLIGSLSAAVPQQGAKVVMEKYGDILSLNLSLIHVAAYDIALRAKCIDSQTLNLLAADKEASTSINFSGSQGVIYTSLKIKIKANYLASGNTIIVSHNANANGVVVENLISTGSVSTYFEINISDPAQELNYKTLSLKFKSNGSGNVLDCIVSDVIIEGTTTTGSESQVTSLDLFEDFDIPMTSTVKDFRELGASSSSFSKTISLPATSKNKLAFGFENELNSISSKFSWEGGYNFIKPKKFELKADGVNLFKGYANLLGSSLDERGAYSLDINLVAGNAGWTEALKQIELKSIQSESYKITEYEITREALNPSLDTEIFFPLVDNGKWKVRDSENPDAVNIGWGNIKAAFSIKKLLEKIFSTVGYTLNSDFLNEDSEFDGDFSIEFGNIVSRLAVIAPSMKKPDFHIQQTVLDASFDYNFNAANTKQNSAFSTSMLDSRPFVSAKHFLGSHQEADIVYFIDWAFIKFNIINQDNSLSHSYEDISATDRLEGTGLYYGSNINQKNKLKNNNLGVSKSVIQVGSSDYYKLDLAINFDLTSVPNTQLNKYGFYHDDNFSGIESADKKTFMTVMLVDEEFANDDIYIDNEMLSLNAFDLYDENAVELLSTDYTDTRVSLNRIQYLEQGKKYHVIAIMGTRNRDSGNTEASGLSFQKFNCGFRINELDLRMSLCESPYAMEGRNKVVYTSTSNPRVTYLDVLPDGKALDFVSEITKCFNLIWTTNEISKEISVEPYNSFYDFSGETYGFNDLTDKALITEIKNNEIINSDLVYSMAKDSSDYSTSNHIMGDSSLSFGDKKVYLSLNGMASAGNPLSSEGGGGISLEMFSSLKMGYAKFICRTQGGNPLTPEMEAENENVVNNSLYLPRIWGEPDSTLEPVLPEQKPRANNSHEYKLCLIKGTKYVDESYSEMTTYQAIDNFDEENFQAPRIHYSLDELFIRSGGAGGGSSDGLFRYKETRTVVYLEVGSYFPFEPSTPTILFSDSESNQGDSASLFSTYHQGLVDMLSMRDKIITAEVYLTAEDVRSINFKQLIKIDNELYILNKIKDFNFSGETTEVELLLVTRTGTNYEIL